MIKILISLISVTFTLGSTQPVWSWLEKMSREEKNNAEIKIFLAPDASEPAKQLAKNIETLWNNGKFDSALVLFPEFKPLTDIKDMIIGNNWRKSIPTSSQGRWGDNVLISSARGVYDVELDYKIVGSNHHTFAATFSGYGTSYNILHIYFSTDKGATWTETYAANTGDQTRDLSAVVCGKHFYVAFTSGQNNKHASIMRFRFTDGKVDAFSNSSTIQTIYNTSSSIGANVLCSAEDNGYKILYYLARQGHELKFFFADTACDSWVEKNTNTTDAYRGIAMCCNPFGSTYSQFACYYDESDTLQIIARGSGDWHKIYFLDSCGYRAYTSAISAWKDTVFCAFEYNGEIHYLRSANGGSHWYTGNVDYATAQNPDVTCRWGGGISVVYQSLTGNKELRYRWRDYDSTWLPPVKIADDTLLYYGCQPAINYLGYNTYGIVFAGKMNSDVVAYYNYSAWTGITEQKDLDKKHNLINIFPNPTANNTKITYALQNPGAVELSIFDISGRQILVLFNGIVAKGKHIISLNCAKIPAGIYFIRIKTNDADATHPLLIVK